MRKMKLKYRLKFSNIIVLVIIIISISVLVCFRIFNNRLKPIFITIANSEAKKISTLIINDAVGKQLASSLTVENLFNISNDSNGNITSIDLNSMIVNKVLTTTTSTAILNLKLLEEGKIEQLELPDSVIVSYDKNDLKKGIIYNIPTGVIFGNTILSNVGPKIPVKFSLIGSVTSNINTKITNYGINNALIEVYVDLTVELEVILPLMTDNIEVTSSIPIAIKLIQGNIPTYYANSLNSPSLSVPIE